MRLGRSMRLGRLGAADKQARCRLGQPATLDQALEPQTQPSTLPAGRPGQAQRRSAWHAAAAPHPPGLPARHGRPPPAPPPPPRLPLGHRDRSDTHGRRRPLQPSACDRAVDAQRGPNRSVAVQLDTARPPSPPSSAPDPRSSRPPRISKTIRRVIPNRDSSSSSAVNCSVSSAIRARNASARAWAAASRASSSAINEPNAVPIRHRTVRDGHPLTRSQTSNFPAQQIPATSYTQMGLTWQAKTDRSSRQSHDAGAP
jgi:hypothetical protein